MVYPSQKSDAFFSGVWLAMQRHTIISGRIDKHWQQQDELQPCRQ